MLEITQKHDFEAKKILGLGVGRTTYEPGWGRVQGQGPKIGKNFFSQKCWKSPKNTILRQKNFWVWG